MQTSTRRLAAASTLAAAALVAGATATSAQAPPAPAEVRATFGAPGKAPTIVTQGIRPGVSHLVVSTSGKGERFFALARLKAGVTTTAFRRATNKELSGNGIDKVVREMADLVASGRVAKGSAYRVTLDLSAARYVLMDATAEKATPQRAFDVAGEPTGAVGPDPVASIELRDFRFVPSSESIPANGLVRFVHAGKQQHFVVAFRARSSAAGTQLVDAIRKNQEKRAERYMAGPPSEPVGLVSSGAVNDVPLKLKKGTYVLACFFESKASRNRAHSALGMVRKINAE